MADQLRLDIQVNGGREALQQLDALQQRVQGFPSTAQAATSALGQHTAALGQATQAAHAGNTAYVSLGMALGHLPGPLGAASVAFGSFHLAMTRSQQGALEVGAALTGLGTGIATGLGGAIQEAAKFQHTFAEVAVVSQASASQMEELRQKALQLGAASTFNSQEVAAGMRELLQAGLTVSQTLQAIEPATRAAMIGNQGLDESTKMIAHTMQQFGMEASQIPHIVDVMTVASQASTLEFKEFGNLFENLRGRTQQLGLSFEEVTAVEIAMVNAGISASAASTALGTAIDRLSKATKDGTDEASVGIRELGLSAWNANGQFVGFAKASGELPPILEQIAARLPSMTQEQQAHAMALLGGARASGAFQTTLRSQQNVMVDGNEVTLSGTALLQQYIRQLENSDGVSARAAETMRATLAVQWKNFNATVQASAIQLGSQFIPALSAALPPLTAFINQFVTASPQVHATTAALLTVGAAVATTGGLALTASVAFAAFGPILLAATAAAAPFLAVIGAIGVASAALAVAWVNDWGNIRGGTSEAVARIQTDLGVLQKAVEQASQFKIDVDFAIPRNLAKIGELSGIDFGAQFRKGVITAMGGGPLLVIEEMLHRDAARAQAAAAEEGKRIGADFVQNVATAALAESPNAAAAWRGVAERLVAEFEGRGLNPDEAREAAALYMGAVQTEIEARSPGVLDAVQGLGTGMAEALTREAPAVINATANIISQAGALLAGAKGKLQDAIGGAVVEFGGDPAKLAMVTNEIISQANAAKALQGVYSGLSGQQEAYIRVIEAQQGQTAALKAALDAGYISQQQYNEGLATGTVKLQENALAARNRAEAEDALKTAQLGGAIAIRDHADALERQKVAALGGQVAIRDHAEALDAEKVAALGGEVAIRAHAEAQERAKTAALGGALAIRDHEEALAREKEQALGGALAIRDHQDALDREKVVALGGHAAIRDHAEALERDKTAALGGEVGIRAHAEALEAQKVAALGGYAAIQAHADQLERQRTAALGGEVGIRDHAEQLEREKTAALGGALAVRDHAESLDRERTAALGGEAAVRAHAAALQFEKTAAEGASAQLDYLTNKSLKAEQDRLAALMLNGQLTRAEMQRQLQDFQRLEEQSRITTNPFAQPRLLGMSGSLGPTTEDRSAAYRTGATLGEDVQAGLASEQADTAAQGRALGQAAADGVAQGLYDHEGAVIGAMQGIILDAIAAAKRAAGIASPSQVAAQQIGVPIAQGIGHGIQQGLADVGAQLGRGVTDLLGSARTQMRQGLAGLSDVGLGGGGGLTIPAAGGGRIPRLPDGSLPDASRDQEPAYAMMEYAELEQTRLNLEASIAAIKATLMNPNATAKEKDSAGGELEILTARLAQVQAYLAAMKAQAAACGQELGKAGAAGSKAAKDWGTALDNTSGMIYTVSDGLKELQGEAIRGGQAFATAFGSVAAQAFLTLDQQMSVLKQRAQDLAANISRTAFGGTSTGLNYSQIYQNTATQSGSGPAVGSSPYGIPIYSPITPGTLRGYANGGMLTEPTLLTNARTGRTFGIAAENGPERIGNGGSTVNVTLQIQTPSVSFAPQHEIRQAVEAAGPTLVNYLREVLN